MSIRSKCIGAVCIGALALNFAAKPTDNGKKNVTFFVNEIGEPNPISIAVLNNTEKLDGDLMVGLANVLGPIYGGQNGTVHGTSVMIGLGNDAERAEFYEGCLIQLGLINHISGGPAYDEERPQLSTTYPLFNMRCAEPRAEK